MRQPDVRRTAIGAGGGCGTITAGRTLRFELLIPTTVERDPVDSRVADLRAVPPPLTLTVLGGFEARRGNRPVPGTAWQRRVAERVVRYLLVRRPGAVAEDALFEAFWPGADPANARRALQVAVSAARTALDWPGAKSVIETAERTYRLRLAAGDELDADRFLAAAAAGLRERGRARRELLERGVSLWTGEPLPEERYSDWATGWRETLCDRYAETLTALADTCSRSGDHAAAVRAARRLIELDRLDESAHRAMIAAYARAGRRAHALRQYLECRRILVDELGIEPSRQTTELQAAVLTGDLL
jgi:DNA-binding SARP family transcriptional activator